MGTSKTSGEVERLRAEVDRLRREAEDLRWGMDKTNQGIRTLYAELERRAEELSRTDRLKSDFVSIVSHELRTPLAIVRESVSQMLDGFCGDLNESQERSLEIVKKNIDRLTRVTNSLLDMSKLESRQPHMCRAPVNLIALAEEACQSVQARAESKRLEIRTRFPDAPVFADVDGDRLTQVFRNLMENAVKFTERGFVEISIRPEPQQITCTVQDSGSGIAPEDLLAVFDKFRQFGRQDGPGDRGTGLGLAICKKIIELHNGEIWVESTPGQGSRFTFVLPGPPAT